MARPQRIGIDYFALDVKMDDEVAIIEAEHGLEGFAVLIKLFQKIYSEGYFYDWGEREQILFNSKVSVDRKKLTTIVTDCVKWGIFDDHMFSEYNILTSKRIQKHYFASIYKRVGVEAIREYLLISVSDRTNVSLIGVSDDGNTSTCKVTDIKSTQSKVKESKEKESTVNKKKEEDKSVVVIVPNNIFDDYAKAGFGIASSVQADKLIELEETYGYDWTRDAIKEAALQSALRLSYVDGILKNWKAKGRNAARPQYHKGKEVKKDFEEREYDYDDLERKLLGWDK